MDFQNRVGSKHGGGGPASTHTAARAAKARMEAMGMETFSLEKDPYVTKNHLGQFECTLCHTIHRTLADYVAHTQGKKHAEGQRRRAAEERELAGIAEELDEEGGGGGVGGGEGAVEEEEKRKKRITIGKPGYRVTKQRDPTSGQLSLLVELGFPEIEAGSQPRFRFVGAYEQKTEPPDPAYQYLVVAADPYDTIAIKVSALAVDRRDKKLFSHWDAERKVFTIQCFFLSREEMRIERERKLRSATGHTGTLRLGKDGRAME